MTFAELKLQVNQLRLAFSAKGQMLVASIHALLRSTTSNDQKTSTTAFFYKTGMQVSGVIDWFT